MKLADFKRQCIIGAQVECTHAKLGSLGVRPISKVQSNMIPLFIIIMFVSFLVTSGVFLYLSIQKSNKSLALLIEYTNEQNKLKKDSLYNEYIKAHEEAKNYEKIIPFL